MTPKILRLAWVWFIIVGGLIITPQGIWCIRCGPGVPGFIGDIAAVAIGIVTIVLGVAGLGMGQKLGAGGAGMP